MPQTHPTPADGGTRTMKAAHLTKWCAMGTVADTIAFGDVPAPPAPVKGEVLVDVKATAVNIDDVATCQDTAGGGWFMHGRKPTAADPFIGGTEYAGVVAACGEKCSKLKPGDRVVGIQDVWGVQGVQRSGTWAEQALALEGDLVPLPADISFVDAAAVAMGTFVSSDLYKRATKALAAAAGGNGQAQPRCLVVGASGGLGTVLLQILRNHKGSRVHITAVCRGANAEMVRRLGADEVVDYTKAPFGEQLAGADKFDVVFDYIGGTACERSARSLLRPGGAFITAVGPVQNVGDRQLGCCEWFGSALHLLGAAMRTSCCCCLPCGKVRYDMGYGMPPLKEEDFQSVVVDGKARAEIALEAPFAEHQMRDALRRVATRHPGGKVVINMERTE